jgi:hypothetical protein
MGRGGLAMRAVTIGFVLALATTATGGIEHTILHGVSVAEVRVWTGPKAVPGLTKEGLQTVAEARLREAGIRLDPAAPAQLWINATVMVADSGACFSTIEAKLVEEARLERNGLRVFANSWSAGALVSAGVETCAERVTESTRSVLADFVENYLAMNPAPPEK